MVSAADFLAGNRHTPMSVLSSSSSSSSLSSASSSFSASHSNLDDNAKAEADLGAEGESGRRRLSAEESMASGATTSGLPHGDFTSEGSSSSSSISTSTSEPESGRKGARGRRGRKSFKEWQDDSRWDLKVRLTAHIMYLACYILVAGAMGWSLRRIFTLHARFRS